MFRTLAKDSELLNHDSENWLRLLNEALNAPGIPENIALVLGGAIAPIEFVLTPKDLTESEMAALLSQNGTMSRENRLDAERPRVICAQRAPTGWVVASMPSAIFTKAKSLLRQTGKRATKISPLFSWVSQARITDSSAGANWTALLEPGLIQVAHWNADAIDFFRVQRIPDGENAAVPLLNRLTAATGLTPGPVEWLSLAGLRPTFAAPWSEAAPGWSLPQDAHA